MYAVKMVGKDWKGDNYEGLTEFDRKNMATRYARNAIKCGFTVTIFEKSAAGEYIEIITI